MKGAVERAAGEEMGVAAVRVGVDSEATLSTALERNPPPTNSEEGALTPPPPFGFREHS